ncbi:MAG: methyltransferase domain-containing protein [Acidobacteria bacterium]|nr:methyltransferase domain-containing protein [Acidobacteriota bacterium]
MTEQIGHPDLQLDEPAPALDSLLFAEQFRLTRDGLVNTTAYVISSIAGMVLIPVLFSGLTHEIYGIWIAALAVQYSSAFLSSGLGRGIAREVAMNSGQSSRDFVVLASFGYFFCAVLGAIVIACVGFPLSSGLHVSPKNASTAHTIFLFVAIGFAGDQFQSLGLEILTGLRRFVTINAINTTFVIIRTCAIVAGVKLGGKVETIAGVHGGLCAVCGAVCYLTSIRLSPRYRPRGIHFRWSTMREQFGFSFASQLTAGATSVLWRSAPFLLGFLKGPIAIVPYELGGKFPMSVSSISWQAADVLFPAASEYHGDHDKQKLQQLLWVGTRGVLVFALPLCLALLVLAPIVLAVWIPSATSEAAWVLRLTTLAVLVDSAAITSIQAVWGCGRVRSASRITLLSALIGVTAAFALVPLFGAPGAAGGLALGVAVSSILFVASAAHAAQIAFGRILAPAVRDLSIPAVLEVGCLLVCVALHLVASLLSLVIAVSIGLIVFSASFYAWSTSPTERKIVAGVLVSLSKTPYRLYKKARRILERIPIIRTAINYTVEIKNTLVDSSARDRAAVAKLYSERDPFGFERNLEQFRFERAIHYVQLAAHGGRFSKVLEVGCAEGMFTRMLAPYCESLDAVDLSPIAIDRARLLCKDSDKVNFREWDVRRDPLESTYDLIVATGVLEYILRPSTLRDAKERITAALKPGAYLLLGNTETGHHIEKTWIGRKLIRGTIVNDLFANDPRYEVIGSSLDQCVCPFAHVLLRRTNAA